MPKGLRPITTYNVFNGIKAVSKNGTATSEAIDLREVAQNGLFTLQYTTTAGSITITYTVCSVKGGTYFTPTGGGAVGGPYTVGSGGVAFEPEMYPFIKIVVTENNSAATNVTLYLNIQ